MQSNEKLMITGSLLLTVSAEVINSVGGRCTKVVNCSGHTTNGHFDWVDRFIGANWSIPAVPCCPIIVIQWTENLLNTIDEIGKF